VTPSFLQISSRDAANDLVAAILISSDFAGPEPSSLNLITGMIMLFRDARQVHNKERNQLFRTDLNADTKEYRKKVDIRQSLHFRCRL
jgi:hypothetical protein